jgi:hypothetical protein
VSDGKLVCADLSSGQSTAQLVGALQSRRLTLFESYVVAIFAASYFCPQNGQRALSDLQHVLAQPS